MNINSLHESALVERAAEAKRPTRWWLAYLFSVVVLIVIVGLVVQSLIGIVYQSEEGSIGGQIVEALTFLGTFGVLALWVRLMEGRPVSSLGFRGPQPLQRFMVGLLLGALMLIVSVLVMVVMGQYRTITPPAGGLSGWAAVIPALLLGVFHWSIQSSTEEAITRGYQGQVGALQLPGWLAILLPGIIFSLLHMTETGLSEPVAMSFNAPHIASIPYGSREGGSRFFAGVGAGAPIRSLADVVRIVNEDKATRAHYGQGYVEGAATTAITAAQYEAARQGADRSSHEETLPALLTSVTAGKLGRLS